MGDLATADVNATTSSDARFHADWDPVIGPEAAHLRHRTWKARAITAYSLFACAIIATAAGAVHHHRVPHEALEVITLVLFLNAGLWLAIWSRRRRREYAAASAFLGIEVSAKTYPPRNPKGFQKWCERHGVTPHATRGSLPPSASEGKFPEG